MALIHPPIFGNEDEPPKVKSIAYWRISSINVDHLGNGANVRLLGYATNEARQANVQAPMRAYEAHLTFEELGSKDPTRADVYAALAKLPEFIGGIEG